MLLLKEAGNISLDLDTGMYCGFQVSQIRERSRSYKTRYYLGICFHWRDGRTSRGPDRLVSIIDAATAKSNIEIGLAFKWKYLPLDVRLSQPTLKFDCRRRRGRILHQYHWGHV